MNFGNHLNETNVAISLRVGVANHLKLVRIYQRNPVMEKAERYNISDDLSCQRSNENSLVGLDHTRNDSPCIGINQL